MVFFDRITSYNVCYTKLLRIGLFYPRVLGMGYNVIMDALNNEFTFQLLLILLFLKILAFSLSLGSGGSGGTIVPSLFAGAMLGGAFGTAANVLFPGTIAESGAYAMVGMGAVFAGTARAPLTVITSYSIHYTKLYDAKCGTKRF